MAKLIRNFVAVRAQQGGLSAHWYDYLCCLRKFKCNNRSTKIRYQV